MAGNISRTVTSRRDESRVIHIIDLLSTISGWIASGMILFAVLLTCQMIFVRFVLNGSTVWQTEAVIYLVVAATLIGLPFVQRMRGHVNVDLVPIYLNKNWRFILATFTLTISCIIVAVMLFYGSEFWYLAYSRGWTSDTVWAVRLWIPYLSLPIGFGLLLLQLLADLLALILKLESPFGLEE